MKEATISITIDENFDTVVKKVKDKLTEAGFGILTTVDVADTFGKKLGISYPPYLILGICSPKEALAVLEAEPLMGTVLPCNIAIYESDSKTAVSTLKPVVLAKMIGKPEIEAVAKEIEGKLVRVLNQL